MDKIKYTDQMQRTVEIHSTVSRIVSLVPSQTELLVDLGLKDRLVGITKFCVHPKELRKEIQLIGGTKNAKIELIQSLNPDLIIGNKEENNQSDIEALQNLCPTWMSDIFNLEDALEMIQKLGEITGTTEKATEIVSRIQTNFSTINEPAKKRGSVLYLIWKNPYIAAAGNTFIDAMLERLGFKNAVQQDRYPQVNLEKLNPDFIFLSSEPFPFKEKHIEELQVQFPNSQVILVDGEFFSWYGSRLVEAPNYFKKLLNLISV
ncbi:ABC transporter substrate-binding protein [Fluviicola taffensis]|uniref:Periplasmic binding protein n=1 Tax=Fluviicola taffensis (strain DSM 16823 / NCIMB 13979 / RW262) TaxID=755732 RepID=F2IIK4_FLUTR|nr:helical backbone metal receptor [Fluviicola taffensis]AEA45966.1 periplasmic binding protein [Fluviicola taffensis DSM 16823]